MSVVSNVILSFSIMEEADDRIKEVNDALPEGQRFLMPDATDQAKFVGGSKFLERPTFLAAFNHVSERQLMDAVEAAAWREPELVQVFRCGQEEDLYAMVRGIKEGVL